MNNKYPPFFWPSNSDWIGESRCVRQSGPAGAPDEVPAPADKTPEEQEKEIEEWRERIQKAFKNRSKKLDKLINDHILDDISVDKEEAEKFENVILLQLLEMKVITPEEMDIPDKLMSGDELFNFAKFSELVSLDAINKVMEEKMKRGNNKTLEIDAKRTPMSVKMATDLANNASALGTGDPVELMRARDILYSALRANARRGRTQYAEKNEDVQSEVEAKRDELKKSYDTLKEMVWKRMKENPADSDRIKAYALYKELQSYKHRDTKADDEYWKKNTNYQVQKNWQQLAQQVGNSPLARSRDPYYLGNYTRAGNRGLAIAAFREEHGMDQEGFGALGYGSTDSARMFFVDAKASGREAIRPGVYDRTSDYDDESGKRKHWGVDNDTEREKRRTNKKQQEKYSPIHEDDLIKALWDLENLDGYKNIEGVKYLITDMNYALARTVAPGETPRAKIEEYPDLLRRFNTYRNIALSRSSSPEIKPNEHGEIIPPSDTINSITVDFRDKKDVDDSFKITRTSDNAYFLLKPNNISLGIDPDKKRLIDEMGIKYSIERSKKNRAGLNLALSVTFYATKHGLFDIQKGPTTTEKSKLDARNVTQVINSNETYRITSLNAEEAERLIEKTGESPLVLDRLKELDAKVAKVFEDFEGPSISLNGLTELSHEAAASLARTDVESISIDGLKSIDENVIVSLGRFPGTISLGGLHALPEITDRTSPLIGKITSLNLNELRSALNIADIIKRDGTSSLKSVSLDRIRTITEEEAKELSKIPEVSLTGLQKEKLDKKTISVLLLDFEDIKLPAGLTTLESVQDAVRGAVSLEGENGEKRAKKIAEIAKTAEIDTLHFKNLTTIDRTASKQIAEFVGSIQCDALVSINDEAIAKNLVKNKENAAFSGCEHLTAAAAKGLANNPRLQTLSLENLKDADVDTLKALAKFQGKTLHLNGINELSADATDALSTYIGALFLNGVVKLESNDLGKLLNQKKWLTLNGLEKLTLVQAQSLGEEFEKTTKRTIFMDGLDYNGSPDEMNILNALLKNARSNITISLRGLHDPSSELEDLLKESEASIIVSDRVYSILYPNPKVVPPDPNVLRPHPIPLSEAVQKIDAMDLDKFLELVEQDTEDSAIRKDAKLMGNLQKVKLADIPEATLQEFFGGETTIDIRKAAQLRAMIARNTAFRNEAVSTKSVIQECQRITKIRENLKGRTIFKNREVIYMAHNEKLAKQYQHNDPDRFGKIANRNSINEQIGSGSIDFIRAEETPESVQKAKDDTINGIKNAKSPLTFYFEGHGSPNAIHLSGTLAGIKISSKELADAFNDRMKRLNVPPPIFITESEYGLPGYSDFSNKFTDDFSETTLGLGQSSIDNPSTLGTVFEHEFDRNMQTNPSVYIANTSKNADIVVLGCCHNAEFARNVYANLDIPTTIQQIDEPAAGYKIA